MTTQPYTREYYHDLEEGSLHSARAVLPHVLELIRPHSVLDVGCGSGGWLQVCRELGIEDICGVDGDYLDRDLLYFPAERFIPHDLRRPLDLKRTFDLVISLEVGEHLPADSAQTYVSTLVHHGPVVLFSAAIPHQPGNDHINLQWPDYWTDLFRSHEYERVDCLRQRVWLDPNVQYWYAQNMVLFASAAFLEANAQLQATRSTLADLPSRLVHPELLEHYVRSAAWFEDRTLESERRVETLESRLEQQERAVEAGQLEREAERRRHVQELTSLRQHLHTQGEQLELATARRAEAERTVRKLGAELDRSRKLVAERDTTIEHITYAPPLRLVIRGIRELALPLGSRRYAYYRNIRHASGATHPHDLDSSRAIAAAAAFEHHSAAVEEVPMDQEVLEQAASADQARKETHVPTSGRIVPTEGNADKYRAGLPPDFAAKIFDVPAQMEMSERLLLTALIVGLQPENALEIGVSHGGSSALIVQAMDSIGKGRLFGIDPEPQVDAALASSIAHRAEVHQGPSPAAIADASEAAGASFEFAFIDGDHTYEGVVRDIEGVLPYLADVAYLLFHDAYLHDVRNAIDAVVRQHGDVLQDCGMLSRSPVRWSGYIDEADTIRYGGLRLLAYSRYGFSPQI